MKLTKDCLTLFNLTYCKNEHNARGFFSKHSFQLKPRLSYKLFPSEKSGNLGTRFPPFFRAKLRKILKIRKNTLKVEVFDFFGKVPTCSRKKQDLKKRSSLNFGSSTALHISNSVYPGSPHLYHIFNAWIHVKQ